MNKDKRYFFALFPDHSVREQIARLVPSISNDIPGDLLEPLDWHITLAFLGKIEQNKEEHLPLAIKNFTVEPFEIELTKVAYWPDSRVIWLGLKDTPTQLLQLVSSITDAVKEVKLSPIPLSRAEDASASTASYQPHVTLLRGAAQPSVVEKIEPIRWRVSEFALAYSMYPPLDGIRYTVRNRWLLEHKQK